MIFRLVTLVTFCLFVSAIRPSPFMEPMAFYTMEELVCAEGYHIQKHEVVTEDGFLLTFFRIPNNKRRPKITNRTHHYQSVHHGYHPDFAECMNDGVKQRPSGPPVLLSHGLLAASDCWVLQGEKFDLAYLLVDEGFDVWFTNIRGNFYSRKHKSLSPSDPKFWDFSFHENGVYDLPAIIDYILEERRHDSLIYVGHSMGTTMYYTMVSEKPKYDDKIKLFVALTPVAHLKGQNFLPNVLGSINTLISILRALARRGVYEFLPRSLLLVLAARGFCNQASIIQNYCYDFVFALSGHHSKLFLKDKLPIYMTHAISGNSANTFFHFQQLFTAPKFQRFNYGPEENFKRYGQVEPPSYDMTRAKTPAAFYYSTDDYIANVKSVKELIKIVPNLIEDHEYSKLSHVDFIWGYTAKDLIYTKILQLIKRFSS